MRALGGLPVVAAVVALYIALVWAGMRLTSAREARARAARVERIERHRRTVREVRR